MIQLKAIPEDKRPHFVLNVRNLYTSGENRFVNGSTTKTNVENTPKVEPALVTNDSAKRVVTNLSRLDILFYS